MVSESENVDRIKRFQVYFDACSTLDRCMGQVFSNNSAKLHLAREMNDHDFRLLACAMFGKANKTFEAVLKLCATGYGEDALVLLRSNLNLVIDFFYILADDSLDRAADCIANGQNEQIKFLIQSKRPLPQWVEVLNIEEIKQRAKRWRTIPIAERAKKAAKQSHYQSGYRFYSSLAHSDARALSSYIEDNSVSGLMVQSSPTDRFIRIALVDNFRLMADVFQGFCFCFAIDSKDAFKTIKENWERLGEVMSASKKPPPSADDVTGTRNFN